ncbi:hypothetical protein [Streptomyces sp. NPDC051776]|uniref:hypothetical protein n=1 Tax=Streptomyces sp. NPDC051776 TaxID=3155414 RepID=UPI0034298409
MSPSHDGLEQSLPRAGSVPARDRGLRRARRLTQWIALAAMTGTAALGSLYSGLLPVRPTLQPWLYAVCLGVVVGASVWWLAKAGPGRVTRRLAGVARGERRPRGAHRAPRIRAPWWRLATAASRRAARRLVGRGGARSPLP